MPFIINLPQTANNFNDQFLPLVRAALVNHINYAETYTGAGVKFILSHLPGVSAPTNVVSVEEYKAVQQLIINLYYRTLDIDELLTGLQNEAINPELYTEVQNKFIDFLLLPAEQINGQDQPYIFKVITLEQGAEEVSNDLKLLLQTISVLNDESKLRLLQICTPCFNRTLLSYAAYNDTPQLMDLILRIIHSLGPEARISYFKGVDSEPLIELIQTSIANKEVRNTLIPAVLTMMNTSLFDQTYEQFLNNEPSPIKLNLLAFTAMHNPKAIPALLDKLRPDQLTRMLGELNEIGSSVLGILICTTRNNAIIKKAFKSMNTYLRDQSIRRQVLMATDKYGNTLFHYAICFCPELLEHLFGSCSKEDKKTLIFLRNSLGVSSILASVYAQNNAVDYLMNFMSCIANSSEKLGYFAEEINGRGDNTLIIYLLSCYYRRTHNQGSAHTSTFPLTMLTLLNDEQRVRQMVTPNEQGFNAFMIAMKYAPEHLAFMVSVIMHMNERDIIQMFTQMQQQEEFSKDEIEQLAGAFRDTPWANTIVAYARYSDENEVSASPYSQLFFKSFPLLPEEVLSEESVLVAEALSLS